MPVETNRAQALAATEPRVRLLILADVRLYREGLRNILSNHDRLVVVGVTSSVEATCRLIDETHPDIVVVDMATRGSHDGIRQIREVARGVHVVGFGVDEEEGEILACAEAGLAGYVPCDASLDDLVACIDAVSRGELRCTPKIAAALFRRLQLRLSESLPPHDGLTPRESEVLRLINSGLSNKEIAVRLHIEVSTVKHHVHNLLEKLNVTSRTQAVARVSEPSRSRGRGLSAGAPAPLD